MKKHAQSLPLPEVEMGKNENLIKMKIEKITIGQSDYTRKQIESGNVGWSIGSESEFMSRIAEYERAGYKVEFQTYIFRRLFALGRYKVTATKC